MQKTYLLNDEILTAADVAKLLKISVRAVNKHAALNKIPCFYPFGSGIRRFYLSDILKYVKRNKNV